MKLYLRHMACLDAAKRLLLLLFFLPALLSAQSNPLDTIKIGVRADFVKNVGQWDDRVCFRTVTQNATMFVERDGFTYVLNYDEHGTDNATVHHHPQRYYAYKMHFAGCQPSTPRGDQQLSGYENHYTSHDRSRWRGQVPIYAAVGFDSLYPGIGMRLYSATVAVKYDFIVAPGADPSQIALAYEGVERVKLLRDGSLQVRTSVQDIIEPRPFAYQLVDGAQRQVQIDYRLNDDTVRFAIGDYDHTLPLFIDPDVIFSTYTGSTADNWGTTATYDSKKNTYTAGIVFNVGYPTSLGAYSDSFSGNADVGIFKFDSSGSQRLYATYLGGANADMPHSLFVNSFDELVIYGTTGSTDFPITAGAYDSTFNGGSYLYYEFDGIEFPNGSDIFVARFAEDGSSLDASTFVGGADNDGLNFRHRYNKYSTTLMYGNDSLYYNYGDGARGELIVDDQNNVYVGTTTFSTDFPVSASALQPQLAGSQEGVIFKIDYNLGNMLWSTYLGGSEDDAVYSLEVDEDYNLLACGGTASHNFPVTAGAYRQVYAGGTTDGFVCKLAYNGDVLMQSTLFGSDAYDQCYFVRRGKNNDVFVFGQTKASGSTLIKDADYNMPGGGQFITHFAPNLDSVVWSTVFGSPRCRPDISPTAFGADICNRVYAVGWGRDFVGYRNKDGYVQTFNSGGTHKMEITSDAYQTTTDGQDFYIMSLSMDASKLEYATFYGELNDGRSSHTGADHVDGGTSRFDRLGCLYQSVCASCGGSDAFPVTSGVWSEHNGQAVYGNCNNAVFKFVINADFPLAEFSAVPVGCAPDTVQFNNTGRGTNFYWDFGDGTTSTERNPVHVYDTGGIFTVRLVAELQYGCSTYDTTYSTVRVLNNTSRHLGEVVSCNDNPIQIGITPTRGCTYRWVSGQVSDSTIANPYVTEAGSYVLQITGAEGCTEIDTFDAVYYDLIDSLYVEPPMCPAVDRNGTAKVVISKYAAGTVHYIWDGTEKPTNVMICIDLKRNLHTLVVYDSLCTSSRQFVNFTPLPNIEREQRTVICQASDCNGYLSARYTDPDSTRTYTYQWEDAPHIKSYERDELCPGTYVLIIKDNKGCTYTDTGRIVVTESFANMEISADSSAYKGTDPHLSASLVEGAEYEWSPETYITDPSVNEPKSLIYDSTLYFVRITDTSGCQYYDSIFVNCIDFACGSPDFFIPNAFTPNGDGQNDRLCFRGADIVTKFHFALFTRWGEKVFETYDINDCWDGRYHDNICMPGVYMYTCRITCVAGQTTEFKGDVTLIR